MMNVKKSVLVVDDEPGICEVLELRLKLVGLDVTTAQSGQEAVGLVEETAPDLVLLDLLMPGMDGYEVLKKIRAVSSVPVIIFTARPDIEDVIDEIGATDFIAKPFSPDALIGKIRLLLNGAS
jgi:DNA-binding response OmpR family regulator